MEPTDGYPIRCLQLRAASSYRQRRAVAHSAVSLLACQRRTGTASSNEARSRLDQATFAGKSAPWMRTAENHNDDLLFLPQMRFNRNLGERRVSVIPHSCNSNSADPNFPEPTSRSGKSHATRGLSCRAIRHPSACRSRDGYARSLYGARWLSHRCKI